MLGGHPEIGWLGEFEYALDPHPEGGGLLAAPLYRARLPEDRRFRTQGFRIDPRLDTADLIRSFLSQARERSGKAQIGASLHRHFERVPRVWPKARIIHLVRDGRDVALSRIGMGWAGNPWKACGHWREVEEAWDRFAAVLPPSSSYEVRYEDLVAEPQQTLEGLCGFLGVAYDPGMLAYPTWSRYGPPDPASGGQWLRRYTPNQLAQVEAEIGEMLSRRGYPLSGVTPCMPVGLARILLELQSWAYQVRFRLRHYGIGVVVAESLARRLGLRTLQRRLQRHLDGIIERQLR